MADQRRAKKKLRPVFSFSVPPEGLDAAFGKDYGEAVERFVREWARPLPRGRPPEGRYTYHPQWATRFRELKTELVDDYESPVDGEQPLGDLEISGLVATEDFKLHPERWKYDPRASTDDLRRAQRRVWNVIKPLI
jgi:hypothetical protein